jgi:hypothetical protein
MAASHKTGVRVEEGAWNVWAVRFQLRREEAQGAGEYPVSEWSHPSKVRVLGDGDALEAVEKLKAHALGAAATEDDEGTLTRVVEFRLLSVRPAGVVNLK